MQCGVRADGEHITFVGSLRVSCEKMCEKLKCATTLLHNNEKMGSKDTILCKVSRFLI
jgi:hypothetical protein